MFKSIAFVALAAASAFAATTLDLSARAAQTGVFNIHPKASSTKCVDVVGGIYANGTQVDIYDCNGTPAQAWQWVGNSLVGGPGNNWCLDAGNVNELQNGVQMKIWQCFPGLPQQTWTYSTSGQIALGAGNFCLDLTNGNTANGNILQIWQCIAGNNNQIWNTVYV